MILSLFAHAYVVNPQSSCAKTNFLFLYPRLCFFLSVTLPKNLQILPASPSKPNRRSMQSPYRLPNPLPPLPVRKGVRGRRPKSETIALLKAVAEAAAAQNGTVPENTQLVPRPHKKRGPKPGSKVGPCRDIKHQMMCHVLYVK